MKQHDKWYLAALMAIAVVILVAGYALKPPKLSADAVISESERFRLQMLAQKRSLQNAGQYFSDLAARAGVDVVGVRGGSGVVWSRGLVVAARLTEDSNPALRVQRGLVPVRAKLTAPNGGVTVLFPAPDETMQAVSDKADAPPQPGVWLVAISRDLDGSLTFLQGTAGGMKEVSCGAFTVQSIVASLPMEAVPAGSGLFDLDGRLTGVALACDGRGITLVTIASVQKLVDSATSLENRLANRLGLRAVKLTAGLAGQFGASEGLLVHEVWDGYPAAAAGLRPGDVLVEANGQLLTSPAILEELTAAAGPPAELKLLRQRRLAQVKIERGRSDAPTAPLMRVNQSDVVYPLIARVPSGSRAESAGLKAGDQVIEVNGRLPVAREMARIESQLEGREPVFLVVRRPGYLAGVFVQ